MTKKLSIETLAVEIKTIRVNGRKMTKAVWNQIPYRGINVLRADGSKTLGKVKMRKGWVILFVDRRGNLRRIHLNDSLSSYLGEKVTTIPQLFITT